MAVSLHKYHNQALSDMMRRFKEQNPVSLHKEVQVLQDTTADWAVHVSPLADKTWKNVVLFYYGNGKYNRSWTSAATGDPMWSLYCSYVEGTAFDTKTACYHIKVVFYLGAAKSIPVDVASVVLFQIVGAMEAEKYVEHYSAGVIPDAEDAVIQGMLALLGRLYSDVKWRVQKELVRD